MSITQQWSILPAFDTDLAGRESKYLREIWFAFLRHVCSLLKCCGSSFLNNHFLLWWVLKSWRRNSSFVGEKFYFKIEGFLIVEFKKFEKAQKSQLSNCLHFGTLKSWHLDFWIALMFVVNVIKLICRKSRYPQN